MPQQQQEYFDPFHLAGFPRN